MNPNYPYDAQIAHSIYDKRTKTMPAISQLQSPGSSDQYLGRRSRVSRACTSFFKVAHPT